MVKGTDTLLVEVAGPQNENLWFLSLERRIRGRFDPTKIPEASGALMKRFPAGIPGQRIGVNIATKTGFVLEPMQLPEFQGVAAECRNVGALPAEREEFKGIDLATWLHHIRGAVQAGKAVVVEGALPEKIDGEPVLSLVARKIEDPIRELAAAIREQTRHAGEAPDEGGLTCGVFQSRFDAAATNSGGRFSTCKPSFRPRTALSASLKPSATHWPKSQCAIG